MKTAPRRDRTHYQILGIAPSASPAEIKKAYRRQVKTYHPDICADPNAAEITGQINVAYDVLSDCSKRLAYDYEIAKPRPAAAQESRPASPWIYCQICGSVNSTLRVAGFYSVVGVLFGMSRSVQGGVLCSECRSRVAFRQNMITAICGWWGIPAFFFAWHALLRNLTGGVQPRKANEELRQALKQQDMYFRSNDPSPQKIRGAYAMRGAIPALLSVGAMTLLCTWGSGSDSPDVARTTTATQHQTRVSTEAVALQRESFTLESEKSALDKEVSRLSNQEAALDSLDGVIERLRSSYEYNALIFGRAHGGCDSAR